MMYVRVPHGERMSMLMLVLYVDGCDVFILPRTNVFRYRRFQDAVYHFVRTFRVF